MASAASRSVGTLYRQLLRESREYSYQLLRSQGMLSLETELRLLTSAIGADAMNQLQLPAQFRGVKTVTASHTGQLMKTVRERARTVSPAVGVSLAETVTAFMAKRVRALRPLHYSRHSSAVTAGVRVDVVSVHLRHFSAPGNINFAYRVKIENLPSSKGAVTLADRTWNIRDSMGHYERISRQPGAGGKQPTLKPGQVYEYASGAVVKAAPAVMRGKFHMVTAVGAPFDAIIAPFGLLEVDSPGVSVAEQELVSEVGSESALMWVGSDAGDTQVIRNLEAAANRARGSSDFAHLLKLAYGAAAGGEGGKPVQRRDTPRSNTSSNASSASSNSISSNSINISSGSAGGGLGGARMIIHDKRRRRAPEVVDVVGVPRSKNIFTPDEDDDDEELAQILDGMIRMP